MKYYHLRHPIYGWCVMSHNTATFFKTPQKIGTLANRYFFEKLRRQRYFYNGKWHDGEDFQIVKLPHKNKTNQIMPYVVLEDLSTYSTLGKSVVAFLNQESNDILSETRDFKHVDLKSKNNIIVPIEDLIDAYNQVHGTNYNN